MTATLGRDPLLAAAEVAEVAASHADATERDRRLAEPVVEALRARDFGGMALPRRLGGCALAPGTIVEVLERIGAADGSAGWVAMIVSTSSLLAGYLPPDVAAAVFADGPRTFTAGALAPKGRGVPAEGGLRVTGRWPFGSGSLHASWIAGGVIVEGRDPLPTGGSDVQTVLMPADDVDLLLDTWQTVGLAGSGSYDFAVSDLFVPATHVVSLITGEPWPEDPLFRFPIFGMLALGVAAVMLGIARGAIDELLDLASEKVPTGSRRRLAERPHTQAAIASSEARLLAARRLLCETSAEAYELAADEGRIDDVAKARLRMAATFAAETSVAVVDAMYEVGGGTSVYETWGLARRFRDVHTASQHMAIAPPTWELAGRILLGLETDTGTL